MFVQTYVFGIGFSNDHFGLQLLRGTTRTYGILCEKGWYDFMVVLVFYPKLLRGILSSSECSDGDTQRW